MAVGADGHPLWLPIDPSCVEHFPPGGAAPSADVGADTGIIARVNTSRWAQLVTQDAVARIAADHGGRVVHLRELLGEDHPDQADVLAAAGYVKNQQLHRFHPADGTPLTFDREGHVGTSACGAPFFPRLDPAVIGLVEHDNMLLVGRNRMRPEFYSLIAGYVAPGETLGAAFAREVWAETGYRIHQVRYLGSQPWPSTGALMLGLHGQLSDPTPSHGGDGELLDVQWVSREDIGARRLPLSPPGSIAHQLIDYWATHSQAFSPQKSIFHP